jgi:endo-beta-N-acetylglucosaminidase D
MAYEIKIKYDGDADWTDISSLVRKGTVRVNLSTFNTELRSTKDSASFAKNAKTSPYLWLLSSLAVFPAIFWWQNTWILQCFALLFCVSYVWAYNALVKFKTPAIIKWFK